MKCTQRRSLYCLLNKRSMSALHNLRRAEQTPTVLSHTHYTHTCTHLYLRQMDTHINLPTSFPLSSLLQHPHFHHLPLPRTAQNAQSLVYILTPPHARPPLRPRQRPLVPFLRPRRHQAVRSEQQRAHASWIVPLIRQPTPWLLEQDWGLRSFLVRGNGYGFEDGLGLTCGILGEEGVRDGEWGCE